MSSIFTIKKELGEGGTIIDSSTKLKLHDKRGAIQDILKAMGWNEAEKIEHSGEINNESKIEVIINSEDINLGKYKNGDNKSVS